MSKNKYDPKRVAQLEYELLGIPLPPEYRASFLRPDDQAFENEVDMAVALAEYDIEDGV